MNKQNISEYLLTVIIPVYNTAKYLNRCIDSVLNQSLKNIQIIIIDDNSSDDSLKLIKKYMVLNPQIKLIENKINLGVGKSRNIGLECSNTKYVSFLDSDDWVDISAYEDSVKYLENHNNCQLAIFGIKTEYESPQFSEYRYYYKHNNIISANYALSLLCKTYNQESYISPLLGSKVYNLEFLQKNNILFDEMYFEDNVFAFKSLVSAEQIIFVPNVYLHYYQRKNSIMHSFSKKHIDDFFKGFVNIKKYLIKHDLYDDLKNQYYSFFEKCYISLFNILFSTEQKVDIQKKYIKYFFRIFEKNFDVDEYIDFVDINKLKNFIL